MLLKYFVENKYPFALEGQCHGCWSSSDTTIDQVVPVYSTSILEGLYIVTEDPALAKKKICPGTSDSVLKI